MTKYGLITETDSKTLARALDVVMRTFPGESVQITEIGIHKGLTSRFLREHLVSSGFDYDYTGIDNGHDVNVDSFPFDNYRLVIGNSIEVYNELHNESQHFIFIDANHALPYVTCDFLMYENKVVPGGLMAFHDTSPHIKPMTDFQDAGYRHDADMYISCRKALKNLGLLDGKRYGWRLLFDEYEEEAKTGGVVVLQKLTYE